VDDERQLLRQQIGSEWREVEIGGKNDRIFGPKLISLEQVGQTLTQQIVFVSVVFVVLGDGFQLRLNSTEIKWVDDSFEKLFSNSGLTRRRSCEKVAEEFLSDQRLERVIVGRVEHHLTPLVDRKAVWVDRRTFQSLRDDFQGLFQRWVLAVRGQLGDKRWPNCRVFGPEFI